MFSRLPESKPQRQRRTGGAIVSTVVHAVFIALAVRATGLKAEIAPEIDVLQKPPVYVEPQRNPEPPAPRTDQPAIASGPSIAAPPTPVLPVVPDVIVPGIPEPGIAIPEDMWAKRGQFAPPNSGDRSPARAEAPNGGEGQLWTESIVDKPILAIPGTSSPRYPAMYQSAGIEGDVRAQFVVDTLGRVERESIKILEADKELFGAAVREALGRARFKPAEAGGRKVRQLAEQVFTFRITR